MGGKTKILLVDRDAVYLKETTEFLESKGFDVVTARTAIDAGGMVTYDRPDVIVTEIALETRDSGFELTRSVKGNANSKHIPVMILTGIKEREGATFTMNDDSHWMKADDFADKPLSGEDLVGRINNLLSS